MSFSSASPHRRTGASQPCRCGGTCARCRAQHRAEGDTSLLPAAVHDALRGAGRTLDGATRSRMEQGFAHDFGAVRVHDDAEARRSADAIGARAYALGPHVVLGGRLSGAAPDERERVLAHELAHVVQQRGQGRGDPSRLEAEARAAAERVGAGQSAGALSSVGPSLARDDGDTPEPTPAPAPEAGAEADRAELACDLGTLGRLSVRAPEVVTLLRLQNAFSACHPGVPLTSLIAGNPCLTPNFGLPLLPAPASTAGPRRGPAAAPGTASPPAAGGGLSLPSTTIRFDLGPASVTVDLPASLAVRLPVAFRGAERIVFSLNASPSEFSFGITINAVPHVRIGLRAAATTEGTGSAGLTIETTRTTCHATDAQEARSRLTRAGTELHDAIQAVMTPPPPAPDASALERDFAPQARLAEVVAKVAALQSEIDRVSAPCREVPAATFQFGVQGPLTAPEPGSTTPPPASFIGGSLRLHF